MPLLTVAERHPEVVHLDGRVVNDELDRRERAIAAQPADAFVDDLTVTLHPPLAEKLVSATAGGGDHATADADHSREQEHNR